MSPIKFLPFLALCFSLLDIGSAFVIATPQHPSNCKRNVVTSFSPTDVADITSLVPEFPSLLLTKHDAKSIGLQVVVKDLRAASNIANPDVQAQALLDGSHLLMDFPDLFNLKTKTKSKATKLKIKQRYAQLAGRLMIISIGFLPGHSFPPEELAIQAFFLGLTLKPVIRSFQLYYCRYLAQDNCGEDECSLDSIDQSNIDKCLSEFE